MIQDYNMTWEIPSCKVQVDGSRTNLVLTNHNFELKSFFTSGDKFVILASFYS